jgi:hypothetical protein
MIKLLKLEKHSVLVSKVKMINRMLNSRKVAEFLNSMN